MTTAWTLGLLLWISPFFGGEGLEGRPIEVTARFPTQKGCHDMVRALVKHTTKHKLTQPCTPVGGAPADVLPAPEALAAPPVVAPEPEDEDMPPIAPRDASP